MSDLFNQTQLALGVDDRTFRKGCRLWFIIFGIAITVIVVAGYSIWKQLR